VTEVQTFDNGKRICTTIKASAPVESISDLREVPDRRILTVLDGMEILESNQRQRLEYGLYMRIQASHPGDAEVTLTNLESFFSDLSTPVFFCGLQ
jgi:hypothetical protein